MYFLQTMHFAESMLHQRKATSPVVTFEGNLAHAVRVCYWTDEEVEHLLNKASAIFVEDEGQL
jgi:phosphohistidine swiveling domain-containing protein